MRHECQIGQRMINRADNEIHLGFESLTGQFTYPFLTSFMLLVHRYVYAAYSEWRTAEV